MKLFQLSFQINRTIVKTYISSKFR